MGERGPRNPARRPETFALRWKAAAVVNVYEELRVQLGIVLAVALFLVGTLWYTHQALADGAQTQQLLRDLAYQRTRLGLQQIDEETGIRGFVITRDRAFLEPYTKSLEVWVDTSRAVRADLHRLGLPPDRVAAIDGLHNRWVAVIARPLIADPNRSNALALEYRGKDLIDRIRLEAIALRLDTERASVRADRDLGRKIETSLILAAAAIVTVLVIGFVVMRGQLRSAQRLVKLNALYDREKSIASMLQDAYLPKGLPALRDIAFDAAYVPASSVARVGGDWYDAFEMPDGRVLFSIGDVAGHGVEAAIVMGRVRQAILVAALQEADPGRVMARANATILLQETTMVTAVCGFIDPAKLEIVYATAGHPAPLLVGESPPAFLPTDGVPLGVTADAAYPSFLTRAKAGDLFVLYTDGVIEHDRDVLAGELRLSAVADGARGTDDVARAIYRGIFDDEPPQDDVAILAITFGRAGARVDSQHANRENRDVVARPVDEHGVVNLLGGPARGTDGLIPQHGT